MVEIAFKDLSGSESSELIDVGQLQMKGSDSDVFNKPSPFWLPAECFGIVKHQQHLVCKCICLDIRMLRNIPVPQECAWEDLNTESSLCCYANGGWMAKVGEHPVIEQVT